MLRAPYKCDDDDGLSRQDDMVRPFRHVEDLAGP